ncbi:hypothetical protein IWQ60_000879 [Tieghemiomyces parasiticus]|uniref:Uncharacterized protein n=1 Tax=Tieghemiomyces parasiticus TaxID=78921 RepID=A0A9W8E2D3_9FUNG|nr:hypothetical protein IWQ60_000879 [Tieghemiomyces parasiticus]
MGNTQGSTAALHRHSSRPKRNPNFHQEGLPSPVVASPKAVPADFLYANRDFASAAYSRSYLPVSPPLYSATTPAEYPLSSPSPTDAYIAQKPRRQYSRCRPHKRYVPLRRQRHAPELIGSTYPLYGIPVEGHLMEFLYPRTASTGHSSRHAKRHVNRHDEATPFNQRYSSRYEADTDDVCTVMDDNNDEKAEVENWGAGPTLAQTAGEMITAPKSYGLDDGDADTDVKNNYYRAIRSRYHDKMSVTSYDHKSSYTDGAAFEFDRYPATASAHYGGSVTLSDMYAVPMASLPRYTPGNYSKGTLSRYSDEDKDGCDDGGFLGLDDHQTPRDSTTNFADHLVQYPENQIPCSPSALVEPSPHRHYRPSASLTYSACE